MELWDKHDLAEFLGIRLDSVNGWLARHGIKPVDRNPAGQGALANVYDAEDIRRAKDQAPGQGHRSDLE